MKNEKYKESSKILLLSCLKEFLSYLDSKDKIKKK